LETENWGLCPLGGRRLKPRHLGLILR